MDTKEAGKQQEIVLKLRCRLGDEMTHQGAEVFLVAPCQGCVAGTVGVEVEGQVLQCAAFVPSLLELYKATLPGAPRGEQRRFPQRHPSGKGVWFLRYFKAYVDVPNCELEVVQNVALKAVEPARLRTPSRWRS